MSKELKAAEEMIEIINSLVKKDIVMMISEGIIE